MIIFVNSSNDNNNKEAQSLHWEDDQGFHS